jgi:hypothetical protein
VISLYFVKLLLFHGFGGVWVRGLRAAIRESS